MAKLNVEHTRQALQNFDFKTLFIEELGWSHPKDPRRITQTLQDLRFQRQAIAELAGAMIIEITMLDGAIPESKVRAAIAKEVQTLYFENVLIFVDQERTKSIWSWLKRQDGKTVPREHVYIKGQPGDLFIAKISALVFDISEFDEAGNIPIVEVAQRMKNALDIERVTKKFFQDYQEIYRNLCSTMTGIDDERQQRWYASVMLHRLMFTYFLQRKLFLDHGNEDYLAAKLRQTQQEYGQDRYYQVFLKPLFFEGFAKLEKDRSPEARRLLGKIVYLNGGLFLPHQIEERCPAIAIPDRAFAEIFALFNRYSWTLDDTPGGQDNEINPSVLGYIFEKYINQKEFGAYYTRTEITEYLCEQTIYRLILDKVNAPGLPEVTFLGKTRSLAAINFTSMPDLLLHLDAYLCRKLIETVLPDLALLDPACGSGAFLVAAMKTLINVYAAVIGAIHVLHDARLTAWLKQIEATHPSVGYYIKKQIITNNLYGVDIMEEAVEIAKLRLFLALVSSAQTVNDLEPLPNIDFNILPGNSLIGLMRVDESKFNQAMEATLFRKSYRQILNEKAAQIRAYKTAATYGEDLHVLRDRIEQQRSAVLPTLNEMLCDEFSGLKIKYEQVTWDAQKNKPGKSVKRALKTEDIAVLRPFHWGFEFEEIFRAKDGFDAIITNPPWEIFKPQAKEFFAEYSELVTKNKMDIKTFEKEQAKLLQNPEIAAAWCEYQSRYPHVSQYFRNAAQFQNQIAIVNGKKAGTDINLYKLFVEQCFNLLRKGGTCGIVIPSGIYTDLGAKQLRQMLFGQTAIIGLFCFENRKEIFEGVHRSFKFVVLTFEKQGQTDRFPAAFMRHDVSELASFPDEHSVMMPVDLIQKLSPNSLSILEFKDEIDLHIAEKTSKFPMLGENIEGTWNVQLTQEVHMTNDSFLFKTTPTKHSFPLVQGNMFHQFVHDYAPPKYWIDATEGRAELLGKKTVDTGQKLAYQDYRLVHRRIAASTNERSLIACVLPSNRFCADTAQSVRNLLPHDVTVFITAMFNSFVLDFQIRQRITAHLDMHFMYTLKLPRLTAGDAFFEEIVTRAARLICTTPEFADLWNEVMKETHPQPLPGREKWTPDCGVTDEAERNHLRAELDGMIANLYGLTQEEFAYILSTFPLAPQAQKDAALACFAAFKDRFDR